MTRRHRFLHVGNGLCEMSFGGVATCALPYANEWHFSDQEHPFSPDHDRPNECAWRLQEGVHASMHMICGGDVGEQAHELNPEPRTEGGEAVMEYPKEESPAEDWRRARVRPPDEAAEALHQQDARNPLHPVEPATERLEMGPSMPVLAREAEQYRWESGRPETLKEANAAPAGAKGAGEEAAGYLESLDVSLNYGPWPVRKFLLSDTSGVYEESDMLKKYLRSLDLLGQDYDLNVWRPENRPYRFAYVTWGAMHGLTIGVACDELVTQY